MENYQQSFVEGCSKIISPLTNLLKKDKCWNWIERSCEAFEEIKKRMITMLILRLLDFE